MITVKATYAGGSIIPEEVDKIAEFKKTLEDGDAVELTFRKWQLTRSQRAFNLLHAALGRYSKALGLNLLHVKDEMCLQAGVFIIYNEHFTPPSWGGHFIEYQGDIYFRKTTNEYTVSEMYELIKYAIVASQENHVDVEDLIKDKQDLYEKGYKND